MPVFCVCSENALSTLLLLTELWGRSLGLGIAVKGMFHCLCA